MILSDDLQARLQHLAECVADVPQHRRAHVLVLIERIERLVPELDPEPEAA